MNHVNVTLTGPVMENLYRVDVEDQYANASVHLDQADIEAMQAEGPSSVMGLVVENIDGAGIDILSAAVANGSPVSIDGEDFSLEDLAVLLKPPAPAAG